MALFPWQQHMEQGGQGLTFMWGAGTMTNPSSLSRHFIHQGRKPRPSTHLREHEDEDGSWPTTLPFPHRDPAMALALSESLAPRLEDLAEPYSLQWFLAIEERRYGRRGRWLADLLEFSRHTGETVLGLGDGMGTDWLQYARHGANVIVCQARAADLNLVRRNFELRQLEGRFLQSLPAHIPLPDESVDVVCVEGLLHRLEDSAAVVAELHRLLKPGGKVLALVPARVAPLTQWLRRNPGPPRGQCFSRRQLRQLFQPFIEPIVYKRHITRRHYWWLCRWIPRPLLERLCGEQLLIKAFKSIQTQAIRLAA